MYDGLVNFDANLRHLNRVIADMNERRHGLNWIPIWAALGLGLLPASPGYAADVQRPVALAALVDALDQVGPGGVGHEAATAAMDQWLADDEPSIPRLRSVLDAMAGASPRAKNWLRLVASDLRNGLPDSATLRPMLQTCFDDRTLDPHARYWSYRELIAIDESVEGSLLDRSRDDPSLPLRFLAIKKAIGDAKELEDEDAVSLLQAVLPLARHPDQLETISSQMSELGEDIELAEQLSMIRDWWVIAPFDNTNGVGFDSVYEVETQYTSAPMTPVSPDVVIAGGKRPLTWLRESTDDSVGELDLNPIFDNEKNAVAYAFCLVRLTAEDLNGDSDGTNTFEARLGCICANEAWVNGTKVLSNRIYHSGSSIDQYVGACSLQPGINSVLVKICQNNQTQSWAQDWSFQFRLTDQTGRGIPFEILSPSKKTSP